MLNAFYNKVRITEGALTRSALLRLRVFTSLALISVPIFASFEKLHLTEGQKTLGTVIIFACLLPLIFGRIMNTLTRTDKNLDEWEMRLKHKAESFAFKTVFFALTLAVFGGVLLMRFSNVDLHALSLSRADMITMLGLIIYCLSLLPVTYVAWTQKPLAE
ncbi:MAG: hypothetical protein V3U82_00720 [Robiginitomaculum sp.]